jgi:hypothetical protein
VEERNMLNLSLDKDGGMEHVHLKPFDESGEEEHANFEPLMRIERRNMLTLRS